jgi:hypothetical protein
MTEKLLGKTMEEKERIRSKIIGYIEGCHVHYMSLEGYGRQRSHSLPLQL